MKGIDGLGLSAKDLVEATVIERATHVDADKVGDTRSFANMERTLTREYWGRFLIELLQNAGDAWRAGSNGQKKGVIRIRLTKDPTLVICNEGEPLTPQVVLQSISKFGESPKAYGAGIGHKGIGFKAVLELTRGPLLYSRSDGRGPFELQVRFDPDEARHLVMTHSPDWDNLVAGLLSAGVEDKGDDRIPVLRFPLWDESPPAWLDEVAQLDGRRFNTVVALPYDPRFDEQLELTRDDFIQRVQRAISELSDEVVLLLSVFERIVIEDEVTNTIREVGRTETVLSTHAHGVTLHEVTISRDGEPSSRWWLFERTLSSKTGLEDAIAVGVRIASTVSGSIAPVAPRNQLRDESTADCFHLFFPTRIRTHLPYLFHAYFEVDAGRKGFAEDKEVANRARLAGLADLALDATQYLVRRAGDGGMDLIGLPGLFASVAGDPDDKLAREFREALLTRLDHEPWVLVDSNPSSQFAAPADLLIDPRPPLPELLPVAFPAAYVRHRLSRDYAETREPAALKFLAERNVGARKAEKQGLDAAALRDLLHPGDEPIWSEDPDRGFRSLLEVLDHTKRDKDIGALLDSLPSDAAAAFIPVLDEGSKRRLRAPWLRRSAADTDESDEVGGILARVTPAGKAPLAPPRFLGLDFVADGVVDAERLSGIGARLGIRPYETESILDAIAAVHDDQSAARELLVFTWRLLLRERLSAYSILNVLRGATTFEPGRWFWSRRDGNRAEADRVALRRDRALAQLRIPTAAGNWRPAGELAFGGDWAEWLELAKDEVGSAADDRAEAYRDLGASAPSPDHLVAGPSDLAALLPLTADDVSWSDSDSGPSLPADSVKRHLLLLHALLLRLGVWEVPPILGYVSYQHPRSDPNPPWASEPDWHRFRRSLDRSNAGFALFQHKNIYVAEDYRLAWPLSSEPTLIRSLSRGTSVYRGYRRAELFCPQCTGREGRRHIKRLSSDNDPRITSYLFWQITHLPWVPTTVGVGQPQPRAPRDAWLEDDRPDAARMQQSWVRFLPLAVPEVSADLAAFAGVRRLSEANITRIERLLVTLRSQFEAGDIDPGRRAGSFESQAFAGLHWRLYERLAELDPDAVRAAITKVGVLAVLGRSLVYRPPEAARHDDGTFSGYKRYFAGHIAFSILARDQGRLAETLGIPGFRLRLERLGGGEETNVTERVRGYIHERAADFLALQVFHPLGSQALQLASRTFTERSERLRRLEVVHVDDLVLRVEVLGTDLVKEVGAGRDQDMFLDDRINPPTLYHDLKGQHWEERFRALCGPYIAALLGNAAYAATFQLLLQQETPLQVEAFLEELSISEEDLALVRRNMDLVSGILRDEERRWWSTLLLMLGSAAPTELDAEAFRRNTKERLEAAVGEGLATLLLGAGGGEDVRHDTSDAGPLAALEMIDVDLGEFHRRLQETGDRGLNVRVASQRLADWRQAHGREVSAILATKGLDLDAVRALPESWNTTPDLAFRIRVSPAEYLAPVLADLQRAGVHVDPDRMVAPDASTYLASLIGETPEGLAAIWRGLFDEQERARLDRDHAAAWKGALRPVLVAARTRPGDAQYIIRTVDEDVERGLPASPPDSVTLAEAVPGLLPDQAGLGNALSELIRSDRTMAQPTVGRVREIAVTFLDSDHLDRVISVLRRGRRLFVDRVRRDVANLREAKLATKPFEGSRAPVEVQPRPKSARIRVTPRHAHDQRTRDRLGLQGEHAALAAVLDVILSRPLAEQDTIIEQLVALLLEVAEGQIVDRLVADGRLAIAAVDEDDRLEALARFLYVGDPSDDFGFDLLGFLVPYAGSNPSPLLLEVKNSADRKFLVSSGEWRRAEEQRERYAFLVVVRSSTDIPAALELIPDPPERIKRRELERTAETWKVRYEPVSRHDTMV